MNNQRHIIPISGKDSLTTAIIQMQDEPEHKYEFMFNPTGAELPEVFEWLSAVEKKMGIKIHHVGESLEKIIKGYNYFLPSQRTRYCTRKAKIKPMVDWIGDDSAIVYFGIRYDEDRKGFNNMWSKNIECEYPLVEHKITIDDVYKIVNESGLKPPTFFWKSLHQLVQNGLGYDPRKVMPEHIFDPVFAWRSRANCYFCFNQRQYEIVGLWEHHPDLAEKALWYESQGPGEKNYTWLKKPFDWYRDNRTRIMEKRAKKIIKLIKAQQQLSLFIQESDQDFTNMYRYSSCGLLCGK